MSEIVIAVDFDGTCVTNEYPYIGSEIGADVVLKELTDKGYLLVLNTMRSGKMLKEAVKWFEYHNIPLYAVKINPKQKLWTKSKKIFANLYIDDAAMGAPVMRSEISEFPYIDWEKAREWLVNEGYL